mgnify:CR=1 FL=1
MKRIFSLVPIFLSVLLLSSCFVSKKKFEMTEAARWATIYSRDSLAELLNGSRIQNESYQNDIELLRGSIKNYQTLLASNQNENQKLSSSLAEKMNELMENTKKMVSGTCDTCVFYDYDEDYDAYVCCMNLDEDEMERFLTQNVRNCHYFQLYDEYKIVQKQN